LINPSRASGCRGIVTDMVVPISSDGGSRATTKREHALLSLRAWQHPEWRPFLEQIGIEPLPIEEVVPALAGQKLEPLQKLRVLHDLGKQGQLREISGPTQEMVGDVVNSGQFDQLVQLANMSLSFGEFVDSLNVQGIVTTVRSIADPDECTDEPIGTDPNRPTKIVASFEADGLPYDFAYGADPLHWPDCNPFFISMTPKNKTPLTVDNVDGNAYSAEMTEVVGIPFLWSPSTILKVRYFVAQDAVGMDYAFLGGDGKIDVDHGFVIVEKHPGISNKVLIRSQKTVHFTGISNFPATLACELGWIDVMQNMASCKPSK
jgi:hypothetical protein